jgi:hypothetical protein
MKIGTYYYPEQWPREQWSRDFDNIAAMGLQIVHMAEFAWFELEPRPGEFRFDWLDECIEMARQRKLDVILCTPTAAPPVWLYYEYPDSRTLDEFGRPRMFGGRRHYSPTSPAMIEASQRIVTAMADRWGNHPSVIGWQIDNEYSNEFDQTEATQRAFRDWVKRKYETIERLNRSWATQFWNQQLTSFDQVELPRTRDLMYDNPHKLIDAQRFWSWAFANFNKVQADILKARVGDRFITTNFMPFYPLVDPNDMRPDLTLYSWDSYPVGRIPPDQKDETYRIADPAGIGFMHDQMASYTGRFRADGGAARTGQLGRLPDAAVSRRGAAVAVDGVRARLGIHHHLSLSPGALRHRAVPPRARRHRRGHPQRRRARVRAGHRRDEAAPQRHAAGRACGAELRLRPQPIVVARARPPRSTGTTPRSVCSSTSTSSTASRRSSRPSAGASPSGCSSGTKLRRAWDCRCASSGPTWRCLATCRSSSRPACRWWTRRSCASSTTTPAAAGTSC